MRKSRIAPLIVCVIALLAAGPVFAQDGPPAPPAAAASAAFSPLAEIEKRMTPLAQSARYSCRRDCSACRRDCYARYRIHCYGPGCRRDFVLCMRGCWYDICRWC